MSRLNANNFRVKVKTVIRCMSTKKDVGIPEKFMHFIDTKSTATVRQLIDQIKFRFGICHFRLSLFIDDYILQEEDPVEVLKEDDNVTACIHKNDEKSVHERGSPNKAIAENGLEEEHQEVSFERSELHASKKKEKKRRHETENRSRDEHEEVSLEVSESYASKKKEKRKRRHREIENGDVEVEERVCSDNEAISSKQRKKRKERNETGVGEEKNRSAEVYEKKCKKRKSTSIVDDGAEDSGVCDGQEATETRKRREIASPPSITPLHSSHINQKRVENPTALDESNQSISLEERGPYAQDLGKSYISPKIAESKSMWDVKETCDSKEEFAVPEIPSCSKDNWSDQRTAANTSFEDSEQSFTEKKKRRRRRKKPPTVPPGDNVSNGITTVYLRNPTLFTPPPLKSGRKKWATATTQHIHFDDEEDESVMDSSDRKTDHMNTSSDLNSSGIKDSSTPLDEEKSQKPMKGLLSMVPRSVSVFKKQPAENVQMEPSPIYSRPMPPQFSSPYSPNQQKEKKEVESPLLNLVGMGNVSFQRKLKKKQLNERQTNISTVYTSPQDAAPEAETVKEGRDDSKENDGSEISMRDESIEREHHSGEDDYAKFRGNLYADMRFQNPANSKNTKPNEGEVSKENGISDEAAGHENEAKENEQSEEHGKLMKQTEEVLASHVLPSKGWYLAFKMLELSAFGCPEVSDMKLAEVMDVDIATKSVTLQCISKFSKRSKGSLMCVEGSDPSAGDGPITISWTDVIEPRQVLAQD